MKNIVTYINDCLGVMPAGIDYANPMNTIGMGNPALPSDNTPGSGDLLAVCDKPKKKKKKSFKQYIKQKKVGK